MENLGYANGWEKDPAIVETCKEHKHVLTEKNISRCVTEFTCEICNYSYKIDSGD